MISFTIHPATRADFERELFDKGAVIECIVAKEDERAIGFALFFHEKKTKTTRREVFLAKIEHLVPCSRLAEVIEPFLRDACKSIKSVLPQVCGRTISTKSQVRRTTANGMQKLENRGNSAM